MEYISTTELRKKTPLLRDSLKEGKEVYLVHRSKVVGVIKPIEPDYANVKFPSKNFLKHLQALSPIEKLTYKQREERKRKYLMSRYGKIIS